MEKLKANLPMLAAIALILTGSITIPAIAFVSAMKPAPSEQNAALQALLSEIVKLNQPRSVDASQDLMPVLQLISQNQKPAAEPLKTALQPVPDPLIMAFQKQAESMSQMMEKFTALEHRLNTMQAQSVNRLPAVDRNGNTAEALNDIYSDVMPPELPDPMVKALAAYPGARVVADPDTGEYIPAVTEWRETSWGGGKQLHLLRHKGKVYGQTVLHKSQTKTPPPEQKKPAFNLNLGNN